MSDPSHWTRRDCCLRDKDVVSPKTSEDPDVWEVDLLQKFGKLPFGHKGAARVILSVYTVLRRHEEFDTGSLGSPSEDFLRLVLDSGKTNSADHDIDAFQGSDSAGLVGIVDLDELGTLGEPLRVGRLDGFLSSEMLRSRQRDSRMEIDSRSGR